MIYIKIHGINELLEICHLKMLIMCRVGRKIYDTSTHYHEFNTLRYKLSVP